MYFLGIIYLYVKHKSISIYTIEKVATVVVVVLVGKSRHLAKKPKCSPLILCDIEFDNWEVGVHIVAFHTIMHVALTPRYLLTYITQHAHPIIWEGFSLGNCSIWAYPTQGMHLFFLQSLGNWLLLSLEAFPTYQRLQSLDELSTKKKKNYQGTDVNASMLALY